jgi:hypothetical protein
MCEVDRVCARTEEWGESIVIEHVGARRKLEWEYIGEGMSGDYNVEDPGDYPHLRFCVSEWDAKNDTWEQLEDASYCTRMCTSTPIKILERFGRYIMFELIGDKTGGYKKAVEYATWAVESDFVMAEVNDASDG